MLVDFMADKYAMTPAAFGATIRATCGLATATPEQIAAFLIVAKEYDLNPLLKEIYAFPSRGGGIVPIVSIDGWVNLVNSHPQCDGFDFAVENDEGGNLYSITCTMHRKDRKHPTVVTEYFSECSRNTEPWKMKHRMLRHKSFIQAARYAFGFAGIYDEDEGRTIAEAVDVTPKAPLRVPSPNEIEAQPEGRDDPEHGSDKYRPGDVVSAVAEKPDPISTGPQPRKYLLPNIETNYDDWCSSVLLKLTGNEIDDQGELESFFRNEVDKYHGTASLLEPDYDDLVDAYTNRQAALGSEE